MIFDSGTSSSDTKIKEDNDYNIKNSKTKTLYLGMICFVTSCLSSIALEVGSRGSYRSISASRPVIFNNLFRRTYNLTITMMVSDLFVALVSSTMLTVGDMYGIPYLYLPWLVNTIEGIALYEGPTIFELAYTILPNASVPAGLFMIITLVLYVEEFYIWKKAYTSFERCWTNYNKKYKLDIESRRNEGICNENKENLNIIARKLEDQQEPVVIHSNEYNDHNTINSIVKAPKNNLSIKSYRSKSLEATG